MMKEGEALYYLNTTFHFIKFHTHTFILYTCGVQCDVQHTHKYVSLCQYEIYELEFMLKSPKILHIKEIELQISLNGGCKSNACNAVFINFSKMF
jgi:hypothetical protein